MKKLAEKEKKEEEIQCINSSGCRDSLAFTDKLISICVHTVRCTQHAYAHVHTCVPSRKCTRHYKYSTVFKTAEKDL